MERKPALAGLPAGELAELLSAYPPFRARQIHKWICGGAVSFDAMTNLPVPLRQDLAGKYSVIPGRVVSELRGGDGTVKLGIGLEDGAIIETVMLRDGGGRKTACLSTQAGCPMGCVFCKTGSLGFRRNLSAAEIAGQFLLLLNKEPDISRIVIMGMGEPLLNLEELRKALGFIMEEGGLTISKRRITLSTAGIVEGILDLAGRGPDIRLALSLASAREDLRERLMPATRGTPLSRVKSALLTYQEKTGRRLTLEITLLGGINTGPACAEAAAGFARGLGTVINLIPWNPVPGLEFEGQPLKPPSARETGEFAAALEKYRLNVTLRAEKGQGVSGACGQLGVLT